MVKSMKAALELAYAAAGTAVPSGKPDANQAFVGFEQMNQSIRITMLGE